jgi:hypothetical protein
MRPLTVVLPVDPADDLICAVLRGEQPAWPWPDDAAAIEAFRRRAELHGVQALLHARLAASDWPAKVLVELRARAVQWAMWELRHQQVLTQTLAALHALGVQPVLIKGTALAYSLYPDPALRTRADTDLIIPLAAKEQVHQILASLGFERHLGLSGEFVSYQASYTQRSPDDSSHTLDLHWKINNSELLSRLFTYDELRREAEPLPALCAHALGAGRVHALLLACMHRCTHKQNPYYVDGHANHDPDRLIWLCDIHLLAAKFTQVEWDAFVRLATGKGLRAVCLEGLRHAQACFHTEYPGAVLELLTQRNSGRPEPAACYLDGGRLGQQWMDFCALGSLPRQGQWLRELFFPPAAYMVGKYPDTSVNWLPWLYLRRAADGFSKRMVQATSLVRPVAGS